MLRERTVPTPGVVFTVPPRGFQRGQGQYPLWRPTHPLVEDLDVAETSFHLESFSGDSPKGLELGILDAGVAGVPESWK